MAASKRVGSSSTGIFTNTIEHCILMCSNVHGNNNKFYSIELQSDGLGKFQLFSHYGRLSGSVVNNGVFEVRDYSSQSLAQKDFNSIISKKQKGKNVTKDGVSYREAYHKIDLVSSSVGSSNVRSVVSKKVSSAQSLNANVFDGFKGDVNRILKMLEEENIHNITSNTTMTYTSNGLQTPLGPLTLEHLSKAKKILDDINNKIGLGKIVDDDVKTLNNHYLSLIPRNLGRNISENSLIYTGEKVSDEYDLLNQMETAIQISSIKDDDAEDKGFDLGFHIELAPARVQKEIISQVEKTRKHSNLRDLKPVRVYQVENFKERARFEKNSDKLQVEKAKYDGLKGHYLDFKEVDLFHGSKNSNILSILMNGIYVPPTSAAHVTARMFGNGVYGADCSTKSLNYSKGNWGGSVRNKNNTIFCFVMRFALGKVHEAGRALQSGTPRGFNSIFAKGGHDLQNNEYIVPNPEQTSISYLIEFESR